MILAKKKILVWCVDPPEDRVISMFAGLLGNHDAHITINHFQCGHMYCVHHVLPVTIRGRPEKTQVSNVLFVIHHPKWSPSVFDSVGLYTLHCTGHPPTWHSIFSVAWPASHHTPWMICSITCLPPTGVGLVHTRRILISILDVFSKKLVRDWTLPWPQSLVLCS
jgi:hypothetical protein